MLALGHGSEAHSRPSRLHVYQCDHDAPIMHSAPARQASKERSRHSSTLSVKSSGSGAQSSHFGLPHRLSAVSPSSSGGDSSESGNSDATKEIMAELNRKPSVSSEWSLLLACSSALDGDSKHKFGHESRLHVYQNDHDVPITHSAYVKASGQTSISMITRPTSKSWTRTGRPHSPLRPGVYAGPDAPESAKARPTCLPEEAKWVTAGTGLFQGISPPLRPATSDVITLARASVGQRTHERRLSAGPSMWDSIVNKMEDEGRTDDSRHYEAWRRRVVDCSRTMQLEVSRFKLEE